MTSKELREKTVEERVDYLQDRIEFLYKTLDGVLKLQSEMMDVYKKEQRRRKDLEKAVADLSLISEGLYALYILNRDFAQIKLEKILSTVVWID